MVDFGELEKEILGTDEKKLKDQLVEKLTLLYETIKTPNVYLEAKNHFCETSTEISYEDICAAVDYMHQVRIVFERNKDKVEKLYKYIITEKKDPKEVTEDKIDEKEFNNFYTTLTNCMYLFYPGDKIHFVGSIQAAQLAGDFTSFRTTIFNALNLIQTGKTKTNKKNLEGPAYG